ncbi:MAG: hypothetical protein JNK27_12765 [Chitinophagaceae bacterium]|nr:hypothetical protein [Chitinophagaceae bacterium]
MMNVRINQLVKSLLQKDSLDQCSLPELTEFAEKNPYFGAAQLLLTKKLQSEQPDRYDEQLQKTLLYFHNPLWVEHLLNETGNAEVIKTKKEEVIAVTAEEKSILSEDPAIASATPEKKDEPVITETQVTPVTEQSSADIASVKIEAVDPSISELTFEPFHTVDYFASQGIRFKEEDKPADKFGKQLKSFTDWLKTMKRLPVTEMAKTVEIQAEQKVEQLAGQSIADREVITEAMAEVWEKQGNVFKAIEIYRKLSLLEPSKSPYFAAKIEELKKTN